MKKLVNYILVVTTSLLLLSCEKEKYPGAYPYDEITFYYDCTVGYGQTKKIIHTDINGWDKKKYPMTFWVDNEEVASITQDGYITGKKNVGTVTVYAKVMSIHGLIEGSVTYKINDNLKLYELIILENLGIIVDVDSPTTAEELANQLAKIKNITSTYIPDTIFHKISPYLGKLDTVKIAAYSQSLDLEYIKIKHLILKDANFEWYGKYPTYHYTDSIANNNTYNEYIKPYVLKNLKINKALEELTFEALPELSPLDLREFKSLKRINRLHILEWWLVPCDIIPPTSIEYINNNGANIIFTDVYNSLHTYNFSCPKMNHTVISKKHLPNLRNLLYKKFESFGEISIDISDYDIEDFNSIKINYVDTLFLSKSVYENKPKDIQAYRYVVIDND